MVEAKLCNTIVGQLNDSYANIEVSYVLDGKVIATKDVTINANNAADSGLTAGRLWANQELRRLAADRLANAQKIKELGTQFSIVTPGTSLLVLENLSDYVRYNIQPPANEPELLAQWKQQSVNRYVAKTDSAQRLQQLTYMIAERTNWYGTEWGKQPRTKATKVTRVPQEGEPGVVTTTHAMESSDSENLDRDPLRPTSQRNSIWNTNDENLEKDQHEAKRKMSNNAGIQVNGGGFTVRGGRVTETLVNVDGLTVSDNITGGLGKVSVARAADDQYKSDRNQTYSWTVSNDTISSVDTEDGEREFAKDLAVIFLVVAEQITPKPQLQLNRCVNNGRLN